MERSALLEKLNKATDRAVTFAIQRGVPIVISKKSTLIGNTFIEKNADGLYDVLSFEGHILFGNISVFDIAVIIAQRYISNEMGVIKQVLVLDERFAKYHTDMIHYLNCMKSAQKRHDIERMAILEDKFQIAEQFAKSAKDRLSIFKKVK